MSNQLFHSWRPQDPLSRNTWFLLAAVITLGAILRLWGLGNIGLHGDEELMSMAARSIVEDGSPVLPSGMYYGRAFPQLYLMATSIWVFGESEWALRLPSALAGILSIFLAYSLGRRFLTPNQSVAFAFVIALLPSMIALSQTARMYGFYVMGVMLLAVAIFRWERTGSLAAYLMSVAACLLALSFHTLTVFSMLLFFFPGLIKGSLRLLVLGAIAFAFCLIMFEGYSSWISSQYFSLVTVPTDDDSGASVTLSSGWDLISIVFSLMVFGATAAGTFLLTRRRNVDKARAGWLAVAVASVLAAFVFTGLFLYHLAGLAFFFGAIFSLRAGLRPRSLIVAGLLLTVLMTVLAIVKWNSAPFDDFNGLMLALLGAPSPWSYVIFSGFAPLAVVVYGIVFAWFAYRFARGEKLRDHLLFLLISVFIPLFLIGFFRGYLPERYIIGCLPFFVLAVFAGIFDFVRQFPDRLPSHPVVGGAMASVFMLALFINPSQLRYNVNPHYEDFPFLSVFRGVDHKGAAEFVLTRNLGSDDLVMAMDAQQQRYYLGERLDYYLRSLNEQRNSSFMHEGVMVNLYTGTPQIATGEELAAIFEEHRYGRIYIIGSGELEANRPRYMGDGIWETMQSYGVELAYEGRDGATKVWRYATDASSPSGYP